MWIQTSFLGDIVLTTAALEAAKNRLPHMRQVVITTPLGARALAGSKDIDSLIVFDKRNENLAKAIFRIRKILRNAGASWKTSTILLPHRSARSTVLARYLGKRRIGYHESNLAFLLTDHVDRVAVFHEAQRIAMLLEPLGLDRKKILESKPVLPESTKVPRNEILARLATESRPIVAIAPGSVWGTKRWPVEKFAELATHLATAGNAVVLIGDAKERLLADELMMKLPASLGTQIPLNIAGLTDLSDLRWLYPKLRLLVCNDSSPLHYASSFDIPTVAIFGATIPEMGFGPLASRNSILQTELSCRPCSAHGPATCPLGHFRCMRTIATQDVLAACRKLMRKNP